MKPETGYARSGELQIAYQVVGTGLPDLVYLRDPVTHLDFDWEEPLNARFFERLASFSRFIRMDRRGTGLSDRDANPASLEQDAGDLLAVLNAVGSDKPFLFGQSQGGTLSLFFAATYPDRCSGVIAYSTPARFMRSADYPYGFDEETLTWWLERVEAGVFGSRETLAAAAPSMASDERYLATFERYVRAAASPKAAAVAFATVARSDIRELLSAVSVPVLVLHRTGDPVYPVEQSRDLVGRLPNARFVELPGQDHLPNVGDQDSFLDEIEEFVTGTRPLPEPDRVFATLLFTDIVSSTERTATLGDRRWREVMDDHDLLVHRELERFRGRLVNPTGDGLLAAFDGPARAIRCAQAIGQGLEALGIEIRAGLHAAEVEARGDDITGIAVNIANRVSSLAKGGELLVSRTVTDLVAGSGIEFEDRGEHELKGVPGRWQLYAVSSAPEAP